MALTPDDVVTKQFQHVRFKEGFDPDEVDDFLDEIVVEASERGWFDNYTSDDDKQEQLHNIQDDPTNGWFDNKMNSWYCGKRIRYHFCTEKDCAVPAKASITGWAKMGYYGGAGTNKNYRTDHDSGLYRNKVTAMKLFEYDSHK